MIIIPEIETVVILVPRTGSNSLRRAIQNKYPRSMLLYRHMEADGIPQGYDRWRKFGIVRHPIDRLWSLYKFLMYFSGNHDSAYVESMRSSVQIPFSDWIIKNQTPFITPYDSAGYGRFFPTYTVRHPLPENRKSQYIYLRPDLGTRIWCYSEIYDFAASILDVELEHHNKTEDIERPALTVEARDYMERWFEWDFMAIRQYAIAA